MKPVLLAHGIWDTGARFAKMQAALERQGFGPVRALTFTPNDGRATIETLARQVREEAEALCLESGATHIDLVGFSMGALVARTYIKLLEGHQRVRTFVSISGPNHGTWSARILGSLSPYAGVRDMAPGSAHLARLSQASWGETRVHVLYTPMDAMILPPSSSRMEGIASNESIPVLVHRFMIEDARVIARVSSLLAAEPSRP